MTFMNNKAKILSLGLAAGMLLGATGCNLATPATVGRIGAVEIPAGVYLLTQYNNYTTVSGLVELDEGQSKNDVAAVLKATATGTIGDEEVTATGEEYLHRLTLRALEYYAATETLFSELGGALTEEEQQSVDSRVDSLWETSGELYAANGIGKESLRSYLLNSAKAQACLELVYGAEGTEPVGEAEYTAFLNDECYYVEAVQLPLMDYSTYAFADDDQKAEIDALADECLETLREASAEEDADMVTLLYLAAMQYVPQAFTALGSTVDSSQAIYYASSQLYTPTTLASYADGKGGNILSDALDAADMGEWVKIDAGMAILVARRVPPLERGTIEQFQTNNSLLDALKGEELVQRLYDDGAALEHALDEGAINTYKASKIKKTV